MNTFQHPHFSQGQNTIGFYENDEWGNINFTGVVLPDQQLSLKTEKNPQLLFCDGDDDDNDIHM